MKTRTGDEQLGDRRPPLYDGNQKHQWIPQSEGRHTCHAKAPHTKPTHFRAYTMQSLTHHDALHKNTVIMLRGYVIDRAV